MLRKPPKQSEDMHIFQIWFRHEYDILYLNVYTHCFIVNVAWEMNWGVWLYSKALWETCLTTKDHRLDNVHASSNFIIVEFLDFKDLDSRMI